MSSKDHTPDSSPVLDLAIIDELRELAGDDEPGLVEELIDIFLDDAPKHLATMARALLLRDLESMHRAAHTLKSASAHMGGLTLYRECVELEGAVRADDYEECRRITEICRTSYEELEKALIDIR